MTICRHDHAGMDVLLLGVSGRIGRRTADELLSRGHNVTGVSRSGTVEGFEDPDLVALSGDATEADDVAKLAAGHDAVVSTLGPSEDEDPEVLTEMMEAAVGGLRRASVDRLVWPAARADSRSVRTRASSRPRSGSRSPGPPSTRSRFCATPTTSSGRTSRRPRSSNPASEPASAGRPRGSSSPTRTARATSRWRTSRSPSPTNSRRRFTRTPASGTEPTGRPTAVRNPSAPRRPAGRVQQGLTPAAHNPPPT